MSSPRALECARSYILASHSPTVVPHMKAWGVVEFQRFIMGREESCESQLQTLNTALRAFDTYLILIAAHVMLCKSITKFVKITHWAEEM